MERILRTAYLDNGEILDKLDKRYQIKCYKPQKGEEGMIIRAYITYIQDFGKMDRVPQDPRQPMKSSFIDPKKSMYKMFEIVLHEIYDAYNKEGGLFEEQ